MHETGLQRTLAIGRLVLDRFFHGSPQAWRDRRRNKNNSVRRLADRAECPLSRSALNQAIGVYALVQTLPEPEHLESLEASHFSLVIPLPPDEQEQWLRRACSEHWSVRRLRQELLEARRDQGERRGRPRLSESDRAITQLRSCTRELESAVDTLVQAGLERSNREALLEVCGRLAFIESKLGDLRHAAPPDSSPILKAKLETLQPSEHLEAS
jgi:hypothetical protein